MNAPDNAEARRTLVKSGDVLISITADLGRVAVVPSSVEEAAHINQHIALFRPKRINPIYLASFLTSSGGKKQFSTLNRQGVKAGLNFDDIRSLKIMVPPIEMQEEFVRRVEKGKSILLPTSRSTLGMDLLFSSLQHRAFSSQL